MYYPFFYSSPNPTSCTTHSKSLLLIYSNYFMYYSFYLYFTYKSYYSSKSFYSTHTISKSRYSNIIQSYSYFISTSYSSYILLPLLYLLVFPNISTYLIISYSFLSYFNIYIYLKKRYNPILKNADKCLVRSLRGGLLTKHY